MSRNPILTDKAFDPAAYGATVGQQPSPSQEWERAQSMQSAGVDATLATGAGAAIPRSPVTTVGRTMTMGGTAAATFLLLMVVVAAGVVGWGQVTVTQVGFDPTTGDQVVNAEFNQPGLLFVAIFVALGFALLTAFKPKLARFTSFGYAIAEGYVLGAISHFYDSQWNGIVLQAVLATGGVFLAMLALYGFRVLRVTPKMVKGIIGATMGVMVLYLVGWIMTLFGVDPVFFGTDGGGLGILFSVVIVGIAAFNLLLDFDFIERGSQSGLPKYMEWYGAFGLLVTLVWIYLEMLRLLARLRQN
jgi:uncharacterized YccA/Bax inhibitor family protein